MPKAAAAPLFESDCGWTGGEVLRPKEVRLP